MPYSAPESVQQGTPFVIIVYWEEEKLWDHVLITLMTSCVISVSEPQFQG